MAKCKYRFVLKMALVMSVCLSVLGCGQKGVLYFPKEEPAPMSSETQ